MYRQTDNRRYLPDEQSERRQSNYISSDAHNPRDYDYRITQDSNSYGNGGRDYHQPHRSPPRGGYPDGSSHLTQSMQRIRDQDAYGQPPTIPRPCFNPGVNKGTDMPPRQRNGVSIRAAESLSDGHRKPYRPESPPNYLMHSDDEFVDTPNGLMLRCRRGTHRLREPTPPREQKKDYNKNGRSTFDHYDINRNHHNDRPRNDFGRDVRPRQECGNENNENYDRQRGGGGPCNEFDRNDRRRTSQTLTNHREGSDSYRGGKMPSDEFDSHRPMPQAQNNYREGAERQTGRRGSRNDENVDCDRFASMSMADNRTNGGNRNPNHNGYYGANNSGGGHRNDFVGGDASFNPLAFNCQENERRGYNDVQGAGFREHSRRNADDFFDRNDRRRDGHVGDRGGRREERGGGGHHVRGEWNEGGGRNTHEERGDYGQRGDGGGYRNGRNDEYGKVEKYESYGEVQGNLEFTYNGRGATVNHNQGDSESHSDYRVVEKAPPGWVPKENPLDELFKNDNLNVSQFTPVVEESIVSGDDEFKEFDSWENSGLHGHLIDVLKTKCGFQKPRKIQAAAIEEIMAGKDVVAQAVTGSGKTFAFVLPIVDKIMKMTLEERGRSAHAPLAIILEPTRELAVQVYDVFRRVTHGTDVQCVRVIGQMDRWEIRSSLSRGVDIYVGTGGRLVGLQRMGDIDLHRLKFFVLDEADKTLNTYDCEHLLTFIGADCFRKTNLQRQNLFFSATVSQACLDMAEKIMKKGFIRIEDKEAKANGLVQQVYVETKGKLAKNQALMKIFEKDKEEGKEIKTLLFVDTRKQSDFLAFELLHMGLGATSINGDRPQDVRDETYRKFMDGTISILVGTDVCSRGWDIPTLQRVINYDLPMPRDVGAESAIDKFIHRIGRTGRVKEGTAITFVDPFKDGEMAKDLVTICREVGQTPPDFLLELSGEPPISASSTSKADAFSPPPGLDKCLDDSTNRNDDSKMDETPILGEGSDDDSDSEGQQEEWKMSSICEETEDIAKGGKQKKE